MIVEEDLSGEDVMSDELEALDSNSDEGEMPKQMAQPQSLLSAAVSNQPTLGLPGQRGGPPMFRGGAGLNVSRGGRGGGGGGSLFGARQSEPNRAQSNVYR